MPYLNDLVSQYESLLSICKHLSSADIIHLAETCKENWASITETKKTYGLLQKWAHCDGKGIAAQAHEFGLHGGDPDKPHWRCLDEECPHDGCKPCNDCGAQVCNNCRFHYYYPAEPNLHKEKCDNCLELEGEDRLGHAVHCKHDAGNYSPDDEEWRDLESNYWRASITYPEPEGEKTCSQDELPAVEFSKAWEIFHRQRSLYSCRGCELLVTKLEDEWCNCTFSDHFINKRWVCIPCLLKELQKANDGRRVADPDGRVWHKCSCSEPAPTDGLPTCRICGHYKFKEWCGARTLFNPYGTDAHSIMSMKRVLGEQLRGTVTSHAEDPILGQLD